jgi:glycosyltransferase involved in cell wall biosynthesis
MTFVNSNSAESLSSNNGTFKNDKGISSISHIPSIVYGTNMWNHYQASVGTELAHILGAERFSMALFQDVTPERLQLGWQKKGDKEWIIGPAGSKGEQRNIDQRCLDADVMIWGDCPYRILQMRVAAGKLSLVSAERILKKPFHRLRMMNPRYALGLARYRAMVHHPKVHSLSIGYFAPQDLRTIGIFDDRVWRWGYFASVPKEPPHQRPKRPLKVLWVGRMIDWKRVDTLVRAVGLIRNLPWFGECTVVGDGTERRKLQSLADSLKIDSSKMRFVAPVAADEVRRLMREADVYVLPSNQMEGWGVVVNEAMAEGCVVVACAEAGASRVLIEDGETGLLFRAGDYRQLASLLERLGQDHGFLSCLSCQAWLRISKLWNARLAAERLIALCSGLAGQSAIPEYTEGPCTPIYRQHAQRSI